MNGSKETNIGTSSSNVSTVARTGRSGYDQLPKELHEMKIRDEKGKANNGKVFIIIHFSLFPTFDVYANHYYDTFIDVKSFLNILYSLQSKHILTTEMSLNKLHL